MLPSKQAKTSTATLAGRRGTLMDISDRTLIVLRDLQLIACFGFAVLVVGKCAVLGLQHHISPAVVVGPRMWVVSRATERDGVKPAVCIWLTCKAGGSSREHRQRGRGYRRGKSLQCGDQYSLAWDKGFVLPPIGVWYIQSGTYGCVVHSPWGTIIQTASVFEVLQVSSVMQVYRNRWYQPQRATE